MDYTCDRCLGKGKITIFKKTDDGRCYQCNGSGKTKRKPRVNPSEIVYLIHFKQAYKHARHYLGTTINLDNRLAEHKSGNGARLLKAVLESGIDFTVVRTWKGGQGLERSLKSKKNSPRLCPCCNKKLNLQAA